jgi:ATP-dependent exoDNAse (exonuclease V) beta subunit
MKIRKFDKHIYDDIGRKYRFHDGMEYYSVTTILGATADHTALEKWKQRIGFREAQRQSEYASKIGTQMHECLEYYLNTKKEPDYPSSVVKNLCKQIEPYLDIRIAKVHNTEMVLYSDRFKLAGTMDAFVDYHTNKGPIPFILDFKTSKRQKSLEYVQDYFIQLALYAMMLEELYGHKVNYGMLLFAYKEVRSPHRELMIKLEDYKRLAQKRVDLFFKNILTSSPDHVLWLHT